MTELFKLILEGKRTEFETRIRAAGEFVFGKQTDELLLRDEILDQFSLSGVPKAERKPNSHLSLLGMVDCWWKCSIVPYDHMICSTPVRFLPGSCFFFELNFWGAAGLCYFTFALVINTNPIVTPFIVVPAVVGRNRVSLPPARFTR